MWHANDEADEQQADEGEESPSPLAAASTSAKRRKRFERTRVATEAGQVRHQIYDPKAAEACLQSDKRSAAHPVVAPRSLVMAWPCGWTSLAGAEAVAIRKRFPFLSLGPKQGHEEFWLPQEHPLAEPEATCRFQLRIHAPPRDDLDLIPTAFLAIDALTKSKGFDTAVAELPEYWAERPDCVRLGPAERDFPEDRELLIEGLFSDAPAHEREHFKLLVQTPKVRSKATLGPDTLGPWCEVPDDLPPRVAAADTPMLVGPRQPREPPPPALLAMGARDERRFHPGQGTELLGFLARVVSGCIKGWLERPV